MINAVIVITHLWNTDFLHTWQFFFNPPTGPWYTGNVYGNLVAIIPTGLLLFAYIRSRHLAVIESHKALKAAHVEHAEKLDKLLSKLDPETPGSLVAIEDMLNPETPTGIGEIIKRLDGRSGQ
jgi:hypothetical protein